MTEAVEEELIGGLSKTATSATLLIYYYYHLYTSLNDFQNVW